MLKTIRDGVAWLVSQPDHARVSGYLAAHWGNDEFAAVGRFSPAGDAEALRAETLFAIAEHDNGWWEWEADPLRGDDGLPIGLSDSLHDQRDGMDRWRRGVPRFRQHHPYASLLISYHAYWLYAPRCQVTDAPFTHPLFWRGPPDEYHGSELGTATEFIREIEAIQIQLHEQIGRVAQTADWIEEQHLSPHVRLLQILDGMSLALCASLVQPSSGQATGRGSDAFRLADVPRRSWDDRVTIKVHPAGEQRISCQPYPFDVDPLPVFVPTRVVDKAQSRQANFHNWWPAVLPQLIRYEYCRA